MKTNFVRAVFDIHCDWEGVPPVYRIYINDELFSERSWSWPVTWHLTQILQIEAPAGEYRVRLEPVGRQIAKFTTTDFKIEFGPALWIDDYTLRVKNAS